MIKKAKIHMIDYTTGTCQVRYLDNQLLSKALTVVASHKPIVGDLVVVIEDVYDGVCFADIYKEVAE